jgi:hypothetical protein
MRRRLLTAFAVALLLSSFRAFLIQQVWNEPAQEKISFVQLLSSRDSRVCRFDCVHYVEITDRTTTPDVASTAFFPAWTTLLSGAKLLAPHVHTEVLAVWLSNLLLLGAAIVSLFLAQELELSTPVCAAFFLPVALLMFPFGASSSFGYGEPLFLLLYLFALLSTRKKQYLWAAIGLGLLSVTRIQGVIVAGAFAFLAVIDGPWLNRRKTVLYTLLALSPFFAYVFWQWLTVGDPLAFVHAQHQWGREFSPLRALLDQAPRPKMFPLMIWICLIGSFFALKKRDFFWSFLALATLGLTEVPLFSGGLMSYARYLSVNVGLFIFLAQFFSRRPAWRIVELALLVWAVQGFTVEATHFLIHGVCP